MTSCFFGIEFWQQIVATTIGVGLAVGIEHQRQTWIERRDKANRDTRVRKLLLDGIDRDRLVLSQMRKSLSASWSPPSQRIATGHIALALSQTDTNLFEDANVRERLLNIQWEIDHINRRAVDLSQVALLGLDPAVAFTSDVVRNNQEFIGKELLGCIERLEKELTGLVESLSPPSAYPMAG